MDAMGRFRPAVVEDLSRVPRPLERLFAHLCEARRS